ncbi:MAG TPA: ATP-binding protein [Thermoanaerobaculia bacterium]
MHSRETAESALLESEERYRAVIGALEEGIVIHEADGTISSCNASACRILGLPQEQILGRSPREPGWRALREDGRPFEPESHPAAITLVTGQPCSQVVMGIEKPGGARVWISINSHPLCRPGKPEPYAAALSFTDITRRKAAEEELRRRAVSEREQAELQEKIRKSSTEWRLTFDAIKDAVLLLEPDGRVIRLNETARELIGVASWDEALYRPLSALNVAQAEPWRTIQALLPRVKATFEGATDQTRDEQGRTWDVSLSSVTSPDGQKGVVAVARDITDLVRLQESLRRSETMSAMGALVAGVAHEVRNPLFGISATLDAFASRFKRRTEYRPYMNILQGEVARLSELMQTLLDYGKPVRLVVAPERPEEVMRAAVAACSPLAAKAGVEIAETADPDLPPLTVDRNRIVQVFQNLLENAVQHSPAGGRVLFRAEASRNGEREGVRFSVEDSGPGFQPGDLERVFEPFFTRRRGGTGMGLSIVQRIVEQHEGEIAAGNRPEGGAVVAVTLPQWRKA